MRTSLFTVVAALAIAAAASAQGPLLVESLDVDGTVNAAMTAATQPYSTGDPATAIPALSRTPGVEPTVASFRIRAWAEGDSVRVLVFAVPRTGQGATSPETQIASVLVPVDGKPVEIRADQYDARPISLAARRLPLMRRYTVKTGIIDTPIPRPWSPPPR